MDLSKLTNLTPEQVALLQSPEVRAILAAVEERLTTLPQVQALEARIDTLVPGWRTSEFWITTLSAIGLLLASLDGLLPPKYALLAASLSTAAYSLSRGIAKRGN